jgi:hypothetical protein
VNLSEMGRRQKDKEDDPFTAQSYQHAQSKLTCIAGKLVINLCNTYSLYLLFQENKSFGVRTICIHPLM